MSTIFKFITETIPRILYLKLLQVHLYLPAYLIILLKSKFYGDNHSNHKVLCISKSIFHDDVKAMAEFSGHLYYIYIPSYFLRDTYSLCFRDKNIDHENYHSSQGVELQKSCYFSIVAKILKYFQNFQHIDAILTANFTYSYLQEIFNAAKILNIKSFVLYKEGLAPREVLSEFVKLYKPYKNLADKVFFYNELNRTEMIKLPVSGMRASNTLTVGIPRMDYYSHNNIRSQKQIVLFSFLPEDKIVALFDDEYKRDQFYDITKQFHLDVMTFASKHSDYKVIIKTKPATKYINYVTEIRAGVDINTNINNLLITSKGIACDYISAATFVLGYNSTTLVEAIVADKPIILPYLKEIVEDHVSDYFSKYPTFAMYARNYEELEKNILNSRYRKYDPVQKDQFLKDMMYKNDGHSSERVEQSIIEELSL